MSRQQIGQFSAFLMCWISDKANNPAILNAIHRATDGYTEERQLAQMRLGNPDGSSSDDDGVQVLPVGEQDHFRFLLHQAKMLVEQVSVTAKTAAASAYSSAMDYVSSNTAVFFQNACPSPDPKKFLLELDDRAGTWDVKGVHLMSQRTSLKTRIIAEVSRAYYVSHFVARDPLAGVVNPVTDCVELPESFDEKVRPRKPQSEFERNEARTLKLVADNTIDPLGKPKHAQDIYQCLIAIEAAERLKKLCEPSVELEVKKVVALSAPPSQCAAAAASAEDDNRSKVRFH